MGRGSVCSWMMAPRMSMSSPSGPLNVTSYGRKRTVAKVQKALELGGYLGLFRRILNTIMREAEGDVTQAEEWGRGQGEQGGRLESVATSQRAWQSPKPER